MTRWSLPLFLLAIAVPASAADWIHWRGPEQTGNAGKVGLPDTFNLSKAGQGNLIWKIPFGGRSAPLVMGGKLYVINGYDPRLATEGERILCFDAETGKQEWEFKFGVFHCDIVSSRLGWTSLTADPAAGTIFAHTTGGFLFCLDAKTGKVVWQRQLTEEFGRVTGYGGRIVSPIFDSGLVVVGVISSGWGDQSAGGNRFLAFDAKTGQVVWTREVTTPQRRIHSTYYSNPVVAVIGGQRLLLSGGAEGSLHAMKLRTGELVWSYHFADGIINPSPVVDGNLVYCCHGEPNPGGGTEGRVICLDGSKVADKKPALVWQYRKSNRFGLASPALADGKLYMSDDGAELFCFDAKTGKVLWKYRYGTTSRGAPLVADGRLYVFDVFAKLTVLKKLGDEEPDEADIEEHRFRAKSGVGFPETNGTPIAVNGRLYFQTAEDLYCVGSPKAKLPASNGLKPMPAETPFVENKIAGARLFPADVSVKPGEKVTFEVVYFDENGRTVKDNRPAPAAKWELPLPPKTPAGMQPPVLAGTIADGTLTVAAQPASQGGYVEYDSGGLKARARVRVVAQIPYKMDFEKNPVGGVPGGWVNASGKYVVEEVGPNKDKVLSKINTNPNPLLARATTYITAPSSTGYTIQCDMTGSLAADKMPDMGVVANRYLLTLDGKIDPAAGNARTLRIVSWEARNRVNAAIPLNWTPGTWYTLKLAVEVKDGKAIVSGKAWDRTLPEPAKWMIQYTDANPNVEGAAGLYGYITNAGPAATASTIHYDNVVIAPTGKK